MGKIIAPLSSNGCKTLRISLPFEKEILKTMQNYRSHEQQLLNKDRLFWSKKCTADDGLITFGESEGYDFNLFWEHS